MSNRSLRLFEHVRKNIRNTKYGIILTYTFDPEFFENSLLPLINESHSEILVFIDENEYYSLLKSKKMKLAGRKYYLIPISLSGIFHPKLAMFISKKQAHLYVGSMNLTVTGFLTNIETLYYIKFPNESVNHVLREIKKFLEEIMKYNPFLQESKIIKGTLNEILEIIENQFISNSLYETKDSTPDIKFIHNLHAPILEEIIHVLDFKPREIHILGPFYGDFSVLKTLAQRFPEVDLYVYLQNGEFNGNVENLEKNEKSHFLNILPEENRYVHAKLLAFSNVNESIIYIGSANPTRAGVLKSAINGGNLEVGIVHKINAEILKDFLATLKPSPIRIDELKSKRLEEKYSTEKPLMSGVVELLDNNNLRVIIKGPIERLKNLEFYIGNRKYDINSKEVKIERANSEVMVVIIKNTNISSSAIGKNNNLIIKYPGKETLEIPVIIKPSENSSKPPVEDVLILNTVLDESFRINIEKILFFIEMALLKNKDVMKRDFKIPNLAIPYKKASEYKRYPTLKLLEKLINRIWELKNQFDKLIFLEDFENARFTLKEFIEALLEAYPYFSEHLKKTILDKIKNTEIENIPSIIEIPPGDSLSILGGIIRINAQDEHSHITIQASNKELMSIFEAVKENDRIFLKIKDKNKLQKKAREIYKEHYDRLIFNSEKSMRTLLYHVFKNAGSFLHLNELFTFEEDIIGSKEDINILGKELIQKMIALYTLVKILDPKFAKHHNPPVGILRAVKLLYPELQYVNDPKHIVKDIEEEITHILDSLKESGIDVPLLKYEDINVIFTNLIMDAKRVESL